MSGSSPERMVLDRDALLERVGYDEEILREIAAVFLDTAPSQLEQVKRAVEAQDPLALHRSAHSLKGAVGNFTLDGPYETALILERMGKQGDLNAAQKTVANLEEELARLSAALQNLG